MVKVEAKVTSFCNRKEFATGIIYVTYVCSTIHTSGNTVNVNVCFTMKLVTGQGHEKVSGLVPQLLVQKSWPRLS